MEKDFLEIHKDYIETQGFWEEERKSFLIKSIELRYKKEVVKKYQVVDVVFNGNEILIKWSKRISELSESEYNLVYAR